MHYTYESIMKKEHLKNVVWKEEKHYVAQCLNVDVSSFGNTKEEALNNLKEALELYFEDRDISKIPLIEDASLESFDQKLQHA